MNASPRYHSFSPSKRCRSSGYGLRRIPRLCNGRTRPRLLFRFGGAAEGPVRAASSRRASSHRGSLRGDSATYSSPSMRSDCRGIYYTGSGQKSRDFRKSFPIPNHLLRILPQIFLREGPHRAGEQAAFSARQLRRGGRAARVPIIQTIISCILSPTPVVATFCKSRPRGFPPAPEPDPRPARIIIAPRGQPSPCTDNQRPAQAKRRRPVAFCNRAAHLSFPRVRPQRARRTSIHTLS